MQGLTKSGVFILLQIFLKNLHLMLVPANWHEKPHARHIFDHNAITSAEV
jgi:hypothetical protein